MSRDFVQCETQWSGSDTAKTSLEIVYSAVFLSYASIYNATPT